MFGFRVVLVVMDAVVGVVGFGLERFSGSFFILRVIGVG